MNIDSLETVHMFDENKVYSGAAVIKAIERVCLTSGKEYRSAEYASIFVVDSNGKYSNKLTSQEI